MFLRLFPSLLFVLLSGIVCADVLLPAVPESYSFPTSSSTTEETDAPIVTSTTHDFTSSITDSAHTDETAGTTLSTTEVPQTDAATEDPSSVTTVSPTTDLTNATTVTPANATTVTPANATTVTPANATTVTPANATTVTPANATTVTPANATTVTPANATTVTPTNATTASIPTTPTPTTTPLPKPSVGEYFVRPDAKSPVCLKANMGLQFRIKLGANFQMFNLDPNITVASGTCGSNGSDSTLILTSGKIDKMTVQFVFANHSSKFHLSALNFTLDTNGTAFNDGSFNLSLWVASLGSSYMCRKEQTYNITQNLVLNTFDLQVQPFGIIDEKFSTAEECFLDADLSFIVPIAVGVALGFLIILVLISYLIGRRKSRTGYQSV